MGASAVVGLLPASDLDASSLVGVPNVKGPGAEDCGVAGAAPNRGLGASAVCGLLPASDLGASALAGVPNAKGVEAAAGALDFIGVLKANGAGDDAGGATAGSATLTGVPNAKGAGEGEGEAVSAGLLGVPNANGKAGGAGFSAGFVGVPKPNGDAATGTGAATCSLSLADSAVEVDAAVAPNNGNAEVGADEAAPKDNCGSLLDASFEVLPPAFSLLFVEEASFADEFGLPPKIDGCSSEAAFFSPRGAKNDEAGFRFEAFVVDPVRLKRGAGDGLVDDFESKAELAKKFGTADVDDIGSDLDTSCLEAAGLGLAETKAISGTLASKGVEGAGADTVLLFAATVAGGVVATADGENPAGRDRNVGLSALVEEDPAAALGVDGFAKENGRLRIGAS